MSASYLSTINKLNRDYVAAVDRGEQNPEHNPFSLSAAELSPFTQIKKTSVPKQQQQQLLLQQQQQGGEGEEVQQELLLQQQELLLQQQQQQQQQEEEEETPVALPWSEDN